MTKSISESSTAILSGLNEEKSVKVLHVDDDLGFLKVAKQCLEMHGEFQVETASSVEEAVEKMKEKKYDAIVSDYKMPGKDGLEFLKELREENNDTPFIIFTGKEREELAIKELLNLGADGYSEKHGEPEVVYRELAHGISEVVEKKRTKDALRSSQAKYKSLLQNIPGMVYRARSDWSTEIIANSKSVCGYAIQEFDSRRVNWLDIIHPDDKARVVKEGSVILGGPASITQEYRIVDKENGVRWMEDHKTSFFSKNGVFEGIDGVVFDVTSRKKTEQALHASLERYRSFTEVTEDLGWTTNADGEIVEDTPSFRKFTGQNYEEVKGWGWSKALHPDDLERITNIWKEATRTKSKYETEYRLRRYDGIYRYFMARSVPVLNEDGSIREWVGTCIDITERQQKEKELQESENKYKKIFEGSNDGIIEVDPSTRRIAFANPAICRLTGYSEKELLKLKVEDIHPKEALPFVIEQLEKLARGEMPRAEAIPVLKKDKSLIYCHINGSTLEIEKQSLVVAFFRDVTESQEAEKALVQSEEKYRALVENTNDIVFTIDLNGITTYVSPSAEKLTGFKPDELMGKPFLNFFKPTEEEIARSNFARMLNGEAVRGVEAAISGKDGTLVYYEANMCPVYSNGNIVGIQGIARDVTENKHWNAELSASKERLSILFERAPDGYYLSDLKGNLIDGNKAAEEITGYSKSELIGRSFLKLGLLPRSQIPKAAKLLALNVVGKPTGPDELILSRKDGSQISVEIRTFPTEIQGRKLVLGIARDITQRKNAENMILESQQRFQSLFSNNPEATIYTDVDSTVVNINQRFTTLFGYSSNEVKGKNINDLIVPKDHAEEAEMLDRKAVEGYAYRDTVRTRKDKSTISVSISAAPVIVQGQLKGYIGVYKDISQLKKAEEELRETMKKLQVLNEKLRVVGSLTRHDVRNKLTAVTGNTYLARKKLPENSEVLEYLRQIESSTEQTVRVLEFAKNYEMLGVEQLDFVDVEKTFNEAISLFSDSKKIKVMNSCHGLTVLADSLLRQLFYNLIDDSLKYGKKLTWIKIRYEEKTDHINMIYEDDGVGIPAPEKPKLFNQGYSTGGSTGYGLYLIKKTTEVYGWNIKENGEAGKGAAFIITIPKTNESHRINYKLH